MSTLILEPRLDFFAQVWYEMETGSLFSYGGQDKSRPEPNMNSNDKLKLAHLSSMLGMGRVQHDWLTILSPSRIFLHRYGMKWKDPFKPEAYLHMVVQKHYIG